MRTGGLTAKLQMVKSQLVRNVDARHIQSTAPKKTASVWMRQEESKVKKGKGRTLVGNNGRTKIPGGGW